MFTKITTFIGLLVLCSAGVKHEYYVSVTQAELNAKTKVIEVSIKLFTDDLEHCYHINTKNTLMLSDPKQHKQADAFFEDYLEEHFAFIAGKNRMKQSYLGFETGPEETYLYLEMQAPTVAFGVKHTVLFDAFKDQINIMHIKANGKNQSFYFSMSKPYLDITL